jgi:hypothetical protein
MIQGHLIAYRGPETPTLSQLRRRSQDPEAYPQRDSFAPCFGEKLMLIQRLGAIFWGKA